MQNELSSRIEKIWAMAEIALVHGSLDYATDGHCKVARLGGMTFKFINDTLMRVKGQRLDISISHHRPQDGVVYFPGAQKVLQFLKGDDISLSAGYRELTAMRNLFSSKKAA